MTDRVIDETQIYREAPRRRHGLYAAMIVAALVFGYWVSPYVAVAKFALAVQSGPDEAVVSRIDVVGLRNHFARQIVRTYIARNPQTRSLDNLSRQAVGSVAAGYVSGIVADYLTPEAITDLLRRGRTSSRAGDLLGQGAPLPRIEGLRQAWSLFIASGFAGLTSFAVDTAPISGTGGYRLTFGLSDARWLLRAVDLPEATLTRLADELSARIERKP